MHQFVYYLADFALSSTVSSYNRGLMGYEACSSDYVTVGRRSLPTPALEKEGEFACASGGHWGFGCLSYSYSSLDSYILISLTLGPRYLSGFYPPPLSGPTHRGGTGLG